MELIAGTIRRYNLVYGDDGAPEMDKETRLRYGETVMTHAMVFTAYDQASTSCLVALLWFLFDRTSVQLTSLLLRLFARSLLVVTTQ